MAMMFGISASGKSASRLPILELILVGLACFAAAWAGIELTRAAGRVAAIWPGNAVLVAVTLFRPARTWGAYLAAGFAANLAANLVSGDAIGPALLLGTANSIEVLLTTMLTRKHVGGAPDFTQSRTLFVFVVVAAVASAVSASLATIILADRSVFQTWFFADTLGLLLLTPMLALLWQGNSAASGPALNWECAALPLAGIAVATLIFSQPSMPLLFLIFPPLIAASFRIGVRGAAAVTFLTLAIAIGFTLSGYGPIANNMADLPSRVLFLQFYATVALLTALPVAAVLSDRMRLDASLAASERRFRTLAEAAPAGIFRSDLTGAVTYVNRAWTELTGIDMRAAQGDGWLQAFAQSQRAQLESSWRAIVQNGRNDVREVRYYRQPDGEERWGAVTVAVERDEAGAPQGQVGIVLDITARKKMERELIAARDQAQEASKAKASFLANMSHEIRTPLNGILGFAELLADSPIPPEQARFAGFIRDSGRELLRLLNDILDLSKIEADQLTVEQRPFSAAEELRRCAKLFDAAVRAKGLSFDLEIEPAVETQMLGDSLRFRQIALNLLSNAAKFTETGSVSISAKVRRNELNVEFADTGIGISSEQKTRIFDPFVQADSSSTRRFGGTGLGLSISRQLADLMGGDILLVSRRDLGTTVTLRLPFKPAPETVAAPDEIATPNPKKNTPETAPKILVVEDIEINRELVCAVLKSAEYAVETAVDGRQAVEMVKHAAESSQPYDLVLMDVQMPVMDGLAATRAIRALPGGLATVPILALTAHAYAAEIEACMDAGMDGHLPKPISATVLLDQLAKTLDRRRLRRTADVLDATVETLRPMFEEQKREIRDRLLQINAELAEGRPSAPLYREAASLAHKVAGFAGTFGEEALSGTARDIERILEAAGQHDYQDGVENMEMLINALSCDAPTSLRKVAAA